jgi:preprotein translocase subunit SecE
LTAASIVSVVDKLKLALALLFMGAGVAGFYVLADSPTVVRIVSVIAGLGLAAAVVYYTEPGRRFYAFSQDSVEEARKVVWPTRKETLQMTGVVLLFVIVMAIFLWLVDAGLLWLVKLVMGRAE